MIESVSEYCDSLGVFWKKAGSGCPPEHSCPGRVPDPSLQAGGCYLLSKSLPTHRSSSLGMWKPVLGSLPHPKGLEC